MEAEAEFERALALDSRYAPAHYHLGRSLERRGETSAAIDAWRKALALDPGIGGAQLSLAHALSGRGEYSEALEHWRAGLQLQPNDVRALREAAWVLATSSDAGLRNGREALSLAVRALQLVRATPAHGGQASNAVETAPADSISEAEAAALDTLAAAYAECGRFADAALTARRALAAGGYPRADQLKQRLRLYERQLPFHMSGAGTPQELP